MKQPFAVSVLHRWRTLTAAIFQRLNDSAGTSRSWQPGGGYDRNVIDQELIEKIRYIHANPLTRGLSPDAVSWRWSSAAQYRQLPTAIGPPIAFDLIPPTDRGLT